MSTKNKLKAELILELARLRESEDRWRTMAESSPDHILMLDPDLIIQSVNHPAPGLTDEELIGASIISFLPKVRQTEVRSILQGVIDAGQAALYDTEFLRPEGEIVYYETHAKPRKSAGKVIGLMLCSRDCTERIQIEKEVRHQGDLIQSIFLAAPIGIGMVSDRTILQANDHLCEMIGYKRDELINKNARMLYPTQVDFEFVGQEKYEQIGKFGTGTVETRFLKKDGEIIDVLLSSAPIDLDDLSAGVTFSALDITERKRGQEELKTATRHWQNTFDAVSDAICLLDSEQRIIQTNQAMNEMFPDDSGKMVGKKCFEIVHGTQEPIENCPILRMKNSLEREEMKLAWDDIYFEVIVDPFLDDSGKLAGAVHSLRDITARVNAEMALEESEERFRILYDQSPDMYVSVSPQNGSVLLCNETLLTKTGYSADEIIGHHVHNLYHDDCLDEVKEVFQEFVEKGKILDRELIIKRKDGSKINVSLNVDSVRNSEGEIRYSISSLRDITERKQAEKEIREKEEKFRGLFDTMSSGVVVYDVVDEGEDFIITDCNPAVETIERVKKEDIIGKRVTQVFPGVKDFGLFEVFQRVSRTEEPENFPQAEYKDERDPGSWRDNWVYKLPGGGIVALYNDITERKQAEKKILKNQYYLTKAQEIGKIGTWELDIQNDILIWTDETYKIFGVPLGTEMNLERMLNCVHPDDQEFINEKWNAALKNEPYDIEHRIVVNDDIKWVREKADFEFDSDGNPALAIGFAQDITERKQVERKLSHSHELMTYIIEHNRSSIAVHDNDLKYIYVSKRYLEEYYVKDPNIIGKHHYDVFPDLPQKWRDVHQKALAGKISFGENDPYYRDDGSVDWTRWECRPWYEEDGTIGGIIVYTEVITDRILAEQEKDNLLEQVQIANDRLQALSRELIKSQEEERKRISQELHDELGQALTAINLDLNILERELDPDISQDIKTRLSAMRTIASELDRKVGDLALGLRPSMLDDLGFIPTLNWYIGRFSQRAEIEVEMDIIGQEKRLTSVIETTLYRITQEALTNVAKHAKAKNVVLKFNLQKESVILNIIDDGRGFDYNEFQNQQAPPQGLGLLGIVERISLVGGNCEIHSKLGEGTRIEIEIPI